MSALSEFSRQPVFKQDAKLWEKWDRAGNALRHRGTTSVAHVVPDSAVHMLGQRIVSDARASGLQDDYGFLPPSSYHMTVLEGRKDYKLTGQAEIWPEWLDNTADFSVAVGVLLERVRAARIVAPETLRMRVIGVKHPAESLTIKLAPADDATACEVARFRHELATVLEIPCFDDYEFHISLGYRLTEAQDMDVLDALHARYTEWALTVDRVDLEPVAFNVFNDMLAFPPLLIF